jgi:hypothetical protein
MVEGRGLGVIGEAGVRSEEENESYMRVAYNRYSNDSFSPYDDHDKLTELREFEFFNSGVLVFNRKLHLDGLMKWIPKYVNEALLKRDQGFINYVAFAEYFEIVRLPYKWNYLGEGGNGD